MYVLRERRAPSKTASLEADFSRAARRLAINSPFLQRGGDLHGNFRRAQCEKAPIRGSAADAQREHELTRAA
jgi:hypothetical protein